MKDYEVVKFNNAKEAKTYLQERKNNDIWIETKISRCRVITAEEARKIVSTNTIPINETAFIECEEDMDLCLKFPFKGKMNVVPLRYTSENSLLDRAGIGGKTIRNKTEKPDQRILSEQRKASILTEFLKLYDGTCKILIREEKISAILSDQYAILSMADLENEIAQILEREYPLAELYNGSASHEYLSLSWKLNDDDMEDELREALNLSDDAGVTSVLKFITSDVGMSNASVYPYFSINGHSLRLGKPAEIKHMGKKTVEDFAKLLPGLNAMFKNNLKYLEKLEGTKILHPASCFRAICCHVGLPKKLCLRLANELEELETCSAFEIYFHLHLFLENNENSDVVSMLRIQELVASTLYLDFKNYDHPFTWEKGE